MFGKPKLRCPKCGSKKVKLRRHFEDEQYECQNKPECGHTGKKEEFIVKKK